VKRKIDLKIIVYYGVEYENKKIEEGEDV